MVTMQYKHALNEARDKKNMLGEENMAQVHLEQKDHTLRQQL